MKILPQNEATEAAEIPAYTIMRMNPCDCPADGFCARYKREMKGRTREICRGENITPEKAAKYRANWEVLARRAGPGTELKALLHSFGITSDVQCGCTDKAHAMDLWGIEGCKEHRAEIIGWLQEAAKAKGWAAQVAAMAGSGWLVDTAIQRAIAANAARASRDTSPPL